MQAVSFPSAYKDSALAIGIGSKTIFAQTTRNLANAQSRLSASFQRLASGLRINRASDDPGGLAVASGLNLDRRVFSQATRNINDGISKFQVADGALEQTEVALNRMAELAAQAASGSLSRQQRLALDKEYNQLDREIRRLVGATTFNGEKLLNGSPKTSVVKKVAATGTSTATQGFAASSDGRYVTMHDSATGTLKQTDSLTGTVTTIATGVSSIGRITADDSGGTVAFISSNNLTGLNSAGAAQVYKWDRTTGTLSQVTNSLAGAAIADVAISGDGSQLAINTNMDYLDGGTIFGNGGVIGLSSLYTINLETNVIRAIHENSSVFHGYASFSSDGRYLAYSSQINYAGGNADNSFEIMLADLGGTSVGIRQITTSSLNELNRPLVNNAGEVFWTSFENLVGQNSVGNNQIYKYSSSTSTISQLTRNNLIGGISMVGLNLSSDGTKLSVGAAVVAMGESATTGVQYEMYRIDTQSGESTKLTNANLQNFVSGSLVYYMSGDGNTLFTLESNGVNRIDAGDGSSETSISTGSGALGMITGAIRGLDGAVRGLGGYTLTSRVSALGALDVARNGLEQLSLLRGEIGAVMSRLDSAARVSWAQNDARSAAYSRIVDLDVAEETASLVTNQIRARAASGLLSQANFQARLALELLKT